MRERRFDATDAVAGVVFIALGAGFGLSALLGLEIGTALRMGPGYVPLALAAVLLTLGVLILLSSLKAPGAPVGPLAWRGMAFILPAPVLFGLAVRPLGFVPAVFAATLLAAFAAPRMRPGPALILAVAVTLFATLVFSVALGLPFRRFGPMLTF